MIFRLVPKSVTLNGVIAVILNMVNMVNYFFK